MTARREPILPTPMPRDDPDGTTVWSDEVGLPGPPRLLVWTVVQEDDATFDLHALWDTDDPTVAVLTPASAATSAIVLRRAMDPLSPVPVPGCIFRQTWQKSNRCRAPACLEPPPRFA